jgi:CheY-like chemotaxis protein
VDDEPLVREVAKRALERAGFEVVLAENGRQAVEPYSQDGARIVLVLLDLSMPEMDGEQTLVELRRIDPTFRCCCRAGMIRPPARARLLEGGWRAFQTLVAAVRRAIA